MHFQFIALHNSIYIIDVMRRAPGDLYFEFIELVYGVKAVIHYIEQFLEEDNRTVSDDIFINNRKSRRVYRHIIFSSNVQMDEIYEVRDSFKSALIYERYVSFTWRMKFDSLDKKVGVLFFDADKIRIPSVLKSSFLKRKKD